MSSYIFLKNQDLEKVKEDLQSLYDDGFRSVAICLLHSYTYPGLNQFGLVYISVHNYKILITYLF